MRILGDIPHDHFKITLLEMNAKLSIQIEDGMLVQTYRFRDGAGIKTLADATKYCDADFMQVVGDTFKGMRAAQNKGLERFSAGDMEGLPEII